MSQAGTIFPHLHRNPGILAIWSAP
jgi:hypothetical protein